MPPRLALLRGAAIAPARPAAGSIYGLCSARHLAILWQNRHDRLMKHALRRLTWWCMAAAVASNRTFAMEARSRSRESEVEGIDRPRLPIPDSRPPVLDSLPKPPNRVGSEPAISAEMRYQDRRLRPRAGRHGQLSAVRPWRRKTAATRSADAGGRKAGDRAGNSRRQMPIGSAATCRHCPPSLARVDLRQLRKSLARLDCLRPAKSCRRANGSCSAASLG